MCAMDANISDLIYEFLERCRVEIFSRFLSGKKAKDAHKFTELLLIDVARCLFGKLSPFHFYHQYSFNTRLQEVLQLRYLTDLEKYEDYRKKRKRLRRYLDRIIKRKFLLKNGEFYVLDTFIITADLNRLRKAKAVLSKRFDVEYLYHPGRGTEVGVIAAVLINLSNLEVVDFKIFSKHAKKTEIWKEMVIGRLGTVAGKVKIVIADAGFFAYDNIFISPNFRIIPVIKKRSNVKIERIEEKLQKLYPNVMLFDARYARQMESLLNSFHEIIRKTIFGIRNYDNIYAKMRSEIEMLFKVAKRVFMLDNVHVYYTDQIYPKVYFVLYISSLFCQFCKMKNLSLQRVTEIMDNDVQIF